MDTLNELNKEMLGIFNFYRNITQIAFNECEKFCNFVNKQKINSHEKPVFRGNKQIQCIGQR